MNRKKIMAALGAAALPVLFIGAFGSPAAADCPGDTFCLYETAGYAGGQYTYKPTTSCTNLGSGIADDSNAMRNYRGYYVKLWDFPGCSGSLTYTANPNSYDSDFGNNGFSNKASSLKRV